MTKVALARQDLADALGISRIQVFKLMKKGMPVDDIKAARAWRLTNLNHAAVISSGMTKAAGANAGRPRRNLPDEDPPPTSSKRTKTAVKKAEPQREAIPQDQPVSSHANELTLKARAERELAQLKVAKETGRVIDRDAAKRAIYEFMRAYRERLLTIPSRVAADLIGVGEVREAEHIIFDGYVKVVTEFENEMPGLLARMTA